MPLTGAKRIAIVTNRFHPQVGGAELNIYLQALELSKHMEVEVLTPLRDNDERTEHDNGIRIYRLRDFLNPRNEFPRLEAATLCPSVFTRILAGSYDLVHCFPALNRNNMLALWASRLRRIPAFLTTFDAFDYARLLERHAMTRIKELRLTTRQRDYLSRFAAIFTISARETALIKEANRNTFLSIVPIQPQEYQQEHDVAGFRRDYDIPEDKMIILCLGRVAHIKGQDILLRAVPKVLERLRDFMVVFVGRTDYEPSFYREMEEYVDRNALQGHVRFTGAVPREKVLAALKACTIHVVPVRFMNSGAVVVETWASGRPVLQSNRVDPNYVEEHHHGLTFDVEDQADLSEKLEYLAARPDACRRMGANGKQLVAKQFLYEHLIGQYMETYERCG